MDHQRFVLKLLQSPMPIIVCLRAKQKSTQTKGTEEMAENGIIQRNQVGKTVIIKDDFTSPIQNEHFISEMMVYMELHKDHTVSVIKHSHPTLRECFPKDKAEPIGIKHGELLAKWCANTGAVTAIPKPKAATEKTRAWMLDQLKDIHVKMQAYGIDKAIIEPNQSLEEWPLGKVPMNILTLKELRTAIENHK
jgi:hypothetical protein